MPGMGFSQGEYKDRNSNKEHGRDGSVKDRCGGDSRGGVRHDRDIHDKDRHGKVGLSTVMYSEDGHRYSGDRNRRI